MVQRALQRLITHPRSSHAHPPKPKRALAGSQPKLERIMSCPSGVAYEPAANPYASVTVTAQNWRQFDEMTPTRVIRFFAGTLRYAARASGHGRFDKPVVGGVPGYRHHGLVPALVDEAAVRELKGRIRGSAQLAGQPASLRSWVVRGAFERGGPDWARTG